MYLHRDTQHGVYGVVIDTSTQGHTTLSTGGAHRYTYTGTHNLDTGGAHRYIYTGAHNLGHRYTTWSTGGSH